MASQTTSISPAEYLAMHFPEREPEYVHGELRYKPMPDRIHGRLQSRIMILLDAALRPRGFSAEPEVRCKLEEDNFRLPDVAVFPEEIEQLLPDRPPFVAVEIVSRDEKHTELLEKLSDYRTWGIPNIWVVDPWRRQLSVFDTSGLRDVESFELPAYGVALRRDELFAGLPVLERKRR